jgi:hypothetical protein
MALNGLVFLCNGHTCDEVWDKNLFALPSKHTVTHVYGVTKDTPMFLLHTDTKELTGPYVFSRSGAPLHKDAFGGKYPAQVEFTLPDSEHGAFGGVAFGVLEKEIWRSILKKPKMPEKLMFSKAETKGMLNALPRADAKKHLKDELRRRAREQGVRVGEKSSPASRARGRATMASLTSPHAATIIKLSAVDAALPAPPACAPPPACAAPPAAPAAPGIVGRLQQLEEAIGSSNGSLVQRVTHLEQLCAVTPSSVSIPDRIRDLEKSAKESGLI